MPDPRPSTSPTGEPPRLHEIEEYARGIGNAIGRVLEPMGRCQGCGESVPMSEVDGMGGHTRSAHDCDGTPESCLGRCPIPIHCGPVTPEVSNADEPRALTEGAGDNASTDERRKATLREILRTRTCPVHLLPEPCEICAAYTSQKYPGRHVCTAAEPYEARKHGSHSAHPDARKVGGSPDGAADDYRCPNCGTEWRQYYDE